MKRKLFITLILAIIISSIGALLKILHKADPLGNILLAVSMFPYLGSILGLVFSKENIYEAKKNK